MAEQYFIAKVYKQHRSLCIAVPKPVCIALGLKAGQHMVFTWSQAEGKFRFKKFKPEGEIDEPDKRDPDIGDHGGGT